MPANAMHTRSFDKFMKMSLRICIRLESNGITRVVRTQIVWVAWMKCQRANKTSSLTENIFYFHFTVCGAAIGCWPPAPLTTRDWQLICFYLCVNVCERVISARPLLLPFDSIRTKKKKRKKGDNWLVLIVFSRTRLNGFLAWLRTHANQQNINKHIADLSCTESTM